jgi:DNA-binding GntR family transcriptional regulator
MENLQIIERQEAENNREYVFRLLRYNIMCLRMVPGELIKENEIAKLLKISRTPVHEAVLMLKENFLVDVLPQSSSKVSLVNLEMMREGYFLRSTLETKIIRQVAGNVSQETLKRMRENLEKQDEVLSSLESVDEFFVLDDDFHGILYDAACKPHIWRMVKNVSSHFDRVRHMDAILMSGNRAKFSGDHKKIYQQLMLGLSPDDDVEGFYENHIGSYKQEFKKC